MLKRIIATTVILAMFFSQNCLYAEENSVVDNTRTNDDVLSLGHYDATTKTTTVEKISLSALREKNAVLKENLALSGKHVSNGYNPMLSSFDAGIADGVVEPQTAFGEYSQKK